MSDQFVECGVRMGLVKVCFFLEFLLFIFSLEVMGASISTSCDTTADSYITSCRNYLNNLSCGTGQTKELTSQVKSFAYQYDAGQSIGYVSLTGTYEGYLCHDANVNTPSGDSTVCIFWDQCLYISPKNQQTLPNSFSSLLLKSSLATAPICAKGSIINVNSLSIGEGINLTGTEMFLSYTTQFDEKRFINKKIKARFDFTSTSAAFKLKVIQNDELIETIPYPALSTIIYEKNWDGKDLSGDVNPFIDSSTFKMELYPDFIPASGSEIAITSQTVQVANYKPQIWGLGGWTLSEHHYYDPKSKTIFLGSGSALSTDLKQVTLSQYGNVYVGPNSDDTEIYIFDQQGRHLETKTTLLAATKYKFIYDNQNRLTKVIDRNSLETNFIRNPDGTLAQIVAPFGQVTNVQVNEFGRLVSASDPVGAVYSMTYENDSGLLSSISYPDNHSVSFEFDIEGLLKRESRSDGFFQEFSNVISATARTVTHLTAGGVKKIYEFGVEGANEVEKTSVSSLGIANEVQASSDTTTIKNSDVVSTTTYAADTRWGNSLRYPSSVTYQNSDYTINRNVTSQKNVTLTDPNNPLSLQSLTEIVGINGKNYSSSFDATKKQLTVSTPLGRKTIVTIDDKERVSKIQEPNGITKTISYNSLGQVSQVSESAPKTYNYQYDLAGNLAAISDSLNNTTQFIRDNNGRVTKKILPNGENIKFEYTSAGNIKKITTPSNQEHVFSRGVMDLITEYIPPLLGIFSSHEQYFYDQDKKITKLQKPSGRAITYSFYPETSYLSSVTTSSGTYNFNSPDAQGRYASVVSPDNFKTNISWKSSSPDRQTLYGPDGQKIGSFDISRDANFNISTITISDKNQNQHMYFSYDDDGRLINSNNLETYSYSFLDQGSYKRNMTNWSWYGGFATGLYQFGFDSNVNDISSMLLVTRNKSSWVYIDGTNTRFDANNGYSIDQEMVYAGPAESKNRKDNYNYDSNHRLQWTSTSTNTFKNGVYQQGPIAQNNYTFGSNNNIVEYNFNNKRTIASYDEQDRLTQLRGSISRDLTYDKDGDLEKISNCLGEKKFEYDEFSNLKKVTLRSGKVIEYKVDAFNRRVARYVNGSPDQYYMWYDNTHLAAVFDKDGNMDKFYIWGVNALAPSMMTDAKTGQTYKLHSTPQGSIRFVMNAQGEFVQEIEYDEFGMVINDTKPGFQPLGYNGGLWDPETELVRFGARDYDPSVSRWTTKDPIGFNGGDTNLYGYVANDPINFVDPMGLWGFQIGVGAGGMLGLSGAGISGGLAVTYSASHGLQIGGYMSSQWNAGIGASAGRGIQASVSPNACSLNDLGGTSPVVGVDTPLFGASVSGSTSNPQFGISVGPSLGAAVYGGAQGTQVFPFYMSSPQGAH